MNAFEVGHVGNNHAQQVVGLTSHKITLHYFGNVTNGLFERRAITL